MSFLVCHVEKLKRGNLYGLQKHEQRENKNYSNEDIDKSQSKLNYDLANKDKINFLDRVDNIIKSQRVSKKAVRKDAVVAVETIISSDKNFFKDLSKTEQKRFFEESFNYFKKSFGKQNIISANVHLDETTPHMHLDFVPMTSDGCLSAKRIINKGTLKKLQTELPKHLREKGFNIERGIENNKIKHMKTIDFKRKAFDKLSKEYDKSLNALKKAIDASKINENILNDLKSIEIKKSLTGAKISLKKDDYENILNLAKSGLVKNNEIFDLKEKIENLHYENSALKNSANYYKHEMKNFEDKLSVFKEQVNSLSDKVNFRTRVIHSMKDTLKKNNCYDEAKDLFNKKELDRKLKLQQKNKIKNINRGIER